MVSVLTQTLGFLKVTDMLDNKFQKTLFHLTSVVTNHFPRAGARFFDAVIPAILGNRPLVNYIHQKNLKTIRRVKKFERILVIPDIHIGDAIMLQAAVSAFRDFFPGARIDYVVKKGVACLLEGHPDISHLYPYFTGTVFPEPSDVQSIQKLVAENQYDLCFNCSPFFEDDNLFPKGQARLDFMTVAPQLVRNDIDQTGINHFLFQAHEFPHKLLSAVTAPNRTERYLGASLILSDQAVAEAKALLKENGIGTGPILFFNPDTASPYTRIPVPDQVDLLKRLCQLPVKILLGSAFTARGLEKKLLESLTSEEISKITVVPTSLSIDGYCALIDFTDVFISGDTGPLHMAAARKMSKSGNFKFKNKTFVISIFGATPARMSGYDSKNPLFPPANQDAQSRTYVSESPCRNITCVNKMAKTCQVVRCFEVLDIENIVVDIKLHLSALQ